MRVASVLPSATEIVCALGHRSELVARSAECDYPASVRALPVVMTARTLDADRPSGEIDARVRRARAGNESLYALDVPLLRRLRPDLLLTQDLCGVCSVTQSEVDEACAAAGIDPRVVSLSPRTLEDVWSTVERVGEALDDGAAGRSLASELRARTSALSASAHRVAVVEWLDPPILAGLWAPDMIRAGGGTPVGLRSGDPGGRTSWAELRALRPDLLVLSPCSFSVGRTRRELESRSLTLSIREVRAPLGTFIADEAFFSRPGPRLADGVDLLRSLLRPGAGWVAPMPVERLDVGGEVVA